MYNIEMAGVKEVPVLVYLGPILIIWFIMLFILLIFKYITYTDKAPYEDDGESTAPTMGFETE